MEQEQLAEFLKESRKARVEDLALVEAMSRLESNEDFKLYKQKVLGTRIESFGQALLDPANGMDGMVRSEFLKGALSSMIFAQGIAGVIVATTAAEMQPQETQENEDAG